MIDIERIAPNAHQILVYGEVSQDDVGKLVAFVTAQNTAEAGGNVLIDLVSMAQFSLVTMAAELVHLPAMLGWLARLDRIAIVSDEDWIRTAARLESALLPGIAYAVYDADELERARAWVLEDTEGPYEGAVIERDAGPDVAVFELVGRLDRTEAENVLARARARLADPACSRLMVVIRKWHGFDPDTALSARVLHDKAALLDAAERYAVVGGPGWLRQMASTFGALAKPEVRAFALEDEAAALAWLRS